MSMLGKRRSPRKLPRRSVSSTHAKNDEHKADNRDGVSIVRLAHDGRGVARDVKGKTLLIDRALPGERVEVAIHRSHRRYDEAHVRRWLETSIDRVSPSCAHYDQCGGCDLQHLALHSQHRHKRDVLIDQLARQGVTLASPPTLIAGDGLGYRRRARLGVKVDVEGRVHLGFRARGSHRLINIQQCPILVAPLAALLPALHEQLTALQAPRRVGHIELLAADTAIAVVVRQLRANAEDTRAWQAWAAENDVSLALLEGRETTMLRWLGDTPQLGYTLYSGDHILQLQFSPGDFLQVNADINQRMISTALDWLQPKHNQRVTDLFAGVGNFSLALGPHVAHVTGVEGSQAMVERLLSNAENNGLHNIEALQADLGLGFNFDHKPDLVVLDPPRDGAESVCRALAERAERKVPRILYISCDPATLARDVAHLMQAGYRITRAAVADMFVQTGHLESMLLLERNAG